MNETTLAGINGYLPGTEDALRDVLAMMSCEIVGEYPDLKPGYYVFQTAVEGPTLLARIAIDRLEEVACTVAPLAVITSAGIVEASLVAV